MKHRVRFLSAFLLMPVLFSSPAPAQLLPSDTAVHQGKLPNGLRYYIHPNTKPANRAELRLVVNAGSVLEEDDQRGLAHVCEHLAFGGTRHFGRNEIVNYLESVGMRFGPDVNAYTGFDETVYMLEIPTDTAGVLDRSLAILEDWAHLVSFRDDAIDRERPVIVEEWRLGRGASARMRDKQLPVLFRGSRYADRMPIGDMDIVRNFKYETLRQFYRKWYRPDLMAVIAVGDFDPRAVEQMVRAHFGGIETVPDAPPRPSLSLPGHAMPYISVVTDSEATLSGVTLYWKHQVEPQSSVEDYRRGLTESIYNSLLNERLSELTKRPDPPFMFASSGDGRIIRPAEFYTLQAGVKGNGIVRGMKAVLREAYRVRRFGFTGSELEREKKDMLRSMEDAYAERDKTESASFASEYIRNFLDDEPFPGIAYENMLYHQLVPEISLAEVNEVGKRWMTDSNLVITVTAPARADVAVPDEPAIAGALSSVAGEDLAPYVDTLGQRPLLERPPAPGTITEVRQHSSTGVTEWRLSNGARVFLKRTGFKNDEVLFSAVRPGGSSTVPDSDFIPAITATSILAQSGLGSYNETDLEKMLAGKLARVSPYIGEIDEGLTGSASPRDLETMFQLVDLWFTAPRADSAAYLAYKSRIGEYLENRSARPESSLEDTVTVTVSQYHPRRKPWTPELFSHVDLRKSYDIYRRLFADPGSFTFFLVGNIDTDTAEMFVRKYLAGLPSADRHFGWKDIGVGFPAGIVEKTVRRGKEPKCAVRIIFSGPIEWSRENRYLVSSLRDVLELKLRDVLREEKGETYGVTVSGAAERDPHPTYALSIAFGCAPENAADLIRETFSRIDSLGRFGVDPMYIHKVQEAQKRSYEVNLKENQFWLSTLQYYYTLGEDFDYVLRIGERIDGLTAEKIQTAAVRYCNLKNYVKVVLLPAD